MQRCDGSPYSGLTLRISPLVSIAEQPIFDRLALTLRSFQDDRVRHANEDQEGLSCQLFLHSYYIARVNLRSTAGLFCVCCLWKLLTAKLYAARQNL